ncbi:MAG TPA: hypothetical protein DCO79_08540, partial [Spirochaeta sp.]|nr:hypothetical protein [Spirochaeta sp.]
TIESIPLKIAIDEVLESLGTQVQDKEIEVVHKYDPEQIIESNSKMFEFVMKNFILNAVKFSERGSRVEITCHAEKSRAAVSVKDYGIGISEENINKLFSTNVNWRIHGTEGENGTGLGLLASSRYADYFGAELSVESTPGIGSTFTIILSADLS